jgi:PAS domain S-box-containing protein
MKRGAPIRILVVDDSEQARYITARVLRQAGYEVDEADSGADGMQKAAELPDLIVMDVKLPDANGIELSRTLKTSPATRDIPILQLSATFVQLVDKVRGLDAGADAYLTRPVESEELLATVRVLLRLSEAQERLTRAEQRQRMALQLGRAFGFEWDAVTDEVVRSEEIGTILGLTGEEVTRETGKRFFQRIHPEDRGRFLSMIKGLSPQANTYKTTYRVLRSDGTVVVLEETGRGTFNSKGVMTSLVGISQDITERKRVEDALMQSEATLRSFFDNAPMMCGIVSLPPEGDVEHVFVNPATLGFYGLDGESIAGRRASELGARPEAIELWRAKYLESARTGRPVYFEFEHGSRCLGTTVSRIPGIESAEQRFLFISEDVTGRKAFEAELERKVKERTQSLQETTDQLNDFCYSIAHDLKAPIRGQTAFSSVLMSDYADVLDETGREYVARIYESATRQATLVNDLLTHMSLGRSELPIERVGLQDAISAVLKELQSEAKERNARIQIENLGCSVYANPASLHLVLSNLLANALKFVPDERVPEVKVECETVGSDCILSVSDNGIGIEPNHFDRIWGVFQRLHTKERYPGTGIGLAIVKKAVERMGGTVGMESQPGIGSRFWVRLPRAKA